MPSFAAMQYRFFSFIRRVVFPVLFAAALTACSSDDDSPDPPPGQRFPVIFGFDAVVDEESALYVGGDSVDTSALLPEDLFSETELANFSPELYENQAYILTEDSLIGPGFLTAVPYYFDHDSLFAVISADPGLIDVPIAAGDYSALQITRGLYKLCLHSGGNAECTQGEQPSPYSTASALSEAGGPSLENFGPEDSLAVYNMVLRFTPL